MKTKIRCPICKDTTKHDASNLFRPFCSERCRLIDLGKWVDEKYSIADASLDEHAQFLPEIH